MYRSEMRKGEKNEESKEEQEYEEENNTGKKKRRRAPAFYNNENEKISAITRDYELVAATQKPVTRKLSTACP